MSMKDDWDVSKDRDKWWRRQRNRSGPIVRLEIHTPQLSCEFRAQVEQTGADAEKGILDDRQGAILIGASNTHQRFLCSTTTLVHLHSKNAGDYVRKLVCVRRRTLNFFES